MTSFDLAALHAAPQPCPGEGPRSFIACLERELDRIRADIEAGRDPSRVRGFVRRLLRR